MQGLNSFAHLRAMLIVTRAECDCSLLVVCLWTTCPEYSPSTTRNVVILLADHTCLDGALMS
eukprot:6345611-Amphidinium_carterae.1